MASKNEKRHIVIVGGGIIGCTTAYFLTRHPKFDRSKHRVTLLEATDHLAPGASGYAGGLLGLWAYPESLAGLSFRLHSELAAEHGGAEKWGYRRLPTYQVYGSVTAKQAEAAFKKEEEESADAIKTETDSKAEEPDVSLSISGDGQPPVKKAKVSRRSSSSALPPADLPEGVDWLDPEVMSGYSSMGDAEKADTAQVHPRLFTQAIAGLARAAGVDIRLNCKVTKILYAARSKPAENDPASSDPAGRPAAPATPSPAPATPEDTEEAEGGTDSPPIQAAAAASSSFGNILQGLEYVDRATNKTHRLSVHSTENNGSSESESDVVTDVVVCAGPWTSTLVPRSNVDGLRVHSILYEADLSPNALFCYVTLPSGWVAPHRVGTVRPVKKRLTVDPEIYPRPDGTVYACGQQSRADCSGVVPLPDTADLVVADPLQCEDLAANIALISPRLRRAPIIRQQACYVPNHYRKGRVLDPMLGPTDVPGLWLAAGHTVWGIQNGPATGFLMARFLLDGEARGEEVGAKGLARLEPRRWFRV